MLNWKNVLTALTLLWPVSAIAVPQISSKHIFVLYPGVDSVFGSYIFMVQNPGQEAERMSFPVMLPAEVIDFQAQEGLAPNELNLGANGGLTIDKTFPPGDTLITIGFKTPATRDAAILTLKAPAAFESIGFFVYEGKFEITGPALETKRNVPFSGRNYDTYTLSGGQEGQTFKLELHGLPEGRGRLWIIGWVLGGGLLLMAAFLAWRTRPKLPEGADVAL